MPGTRKRPRLGDVEPEYPQKLEGSFHISTSEYAAVERALANGLDPNVLWKEEDLVIPNPKGGCVVPLYVPSSEAWPHYNTPLHRALCFSDFESADLLLRHGADVDLYNSLGRTPLHEAVWNREHGAIGFLLERNADVDKVTLEAHVRWEDDDRDIHGRGGELNLQRALASSDATALRLLVDGGVNLCPDSHGPWTALDLALLVEDRWAVEVLLPRGVELLAEPPTPDSAEFDCAGDSRRLLAFTRIRDLVPLPELHRAYRHAAWQAKERGMIGPDYTTINAESLIRGVFEALREAASYQQPHGNMCAPCRTFQLEASCTFATRKPFTFQLHENRDQLDDSAKSGCPLCAIAADALDLAEKDAAADHEDPEVQSTRKQSSDSPVTLTTRIYASPSEIFISSLITTCGELSKGMDCMELSDRTAIPTSKGRDNPDDSTGSDSAMHVAKKWLEACQNDDAHSACQQQCGERSTSDSRPGRLLHIREASGNPRLVAGDGIQAPYCALLYSWGQKGVFATTRGSLSRNMSGIPLDCLPAVMVDAIYVARTLGYSYLWVDALCIVQDDKEDWASEAARMHTIYSNAELTISTLVGSDCRTSLFQPRSLRATHPVPLDIWQPKLDRSQLAVVPEWAKRNPGLRGPVHARAWALQEQLFSRRILYFGSGMLHWECLTAYRLEADPCGDQARHYTYGSALEKRIETKRAMRGGVSNEKAGDGESSLSERLFEFWKTQLEEFTRRKLSYPLDRLPAFASISEALARAAGQKSPGGIWDGNRLPESLCWRVVEPRDGNGTPGMPSWTWASVDGAISFDPVARGSREGVDVIPGITVEALDVEVDESTSRVHGSLTIRANLRRKRAFRPARSTSRSSLQPLRMRRYGSDAGGVFLDHAPESVEDVYAVNVLSFPRGPPYKGFGRPMFPNGREPMTVRLLLQPVGSELDVFRRVGIGIYPGLHTDIECKVDAGKPRSPLEWLGTDEEEFEGRQIVIV